MNAQTKLSAKGQVVIPKSVRERLSWSEGDRLEVIETGNGVFLQARQADGERITVEEFRRRVPSHSGPPVSFEAMEDAILSEAAARFQRKTQR